MKLIKRIVPYSIRKYLSSVLEKYRLMSLRNNILASYESNIVIDEEISEALTFLKKNTLQVFPYLFVKQYDNMDIRVYYDEKNHFPYVLYDDKKLFFKKKWNENYIKKYYKSLLTEQDLNSPHRYLTDKFKVEEGDVVIDIGVAEGNFSLSVVDKAKHIYIFETDLEWIECINLSFRLWKEKITIVNKFVSDIDSETDIRLDTYFKSDANIDFIKIDVDGAEERLLVGAENILDTKPDLKIAICTYHKQQDEEQFSTMLKEKNFHHETSKGYMLFHYDKLEFPFFRRGLIRAWKNSTKTS